MSAIIQIHKGKLLEDNKKVEVHVTRRLNDDSKPSKCKEEYEDRPNDDLIKAFALLEIHAAVGFNIIKSSEVKNIKKFPKEFTENIHVTGFTITGNMDGVIISAQQKGEYGSGGFNTPTLRFKSEGEKAYPFGEDLKAAAEKCKEEMALYLGGKFWIDPQGKLDLK